MKAKNYRWTPLVAALILAIGLQVVWGFAFMYTAAIVASLRQDANQPQESLTVSIDGTPMIGTYNYTGTVNWNYRTIDGKPLDRRESDPQLTGATFVDRGARAEPAIAKGWTERVSQSGISDRQQPGTNWFVVRDAQPVGHAYLIGFDARSKLVAGYIGRKGFSQSLPPKDEWFEIGAHSSNQLGGGLITFAGGLRMIAVPPTLNTFIVDGDKLIEIDLRARTVKTAIEVARLEAIAPISGHFAGTMKERSKEAQAEWAKALAAGLVSENMLKSMASIQQAIAIRSDESITVFGPESGSKIVYSLPKSLRDRRMTVYELSGEQLLVIWNEMSRRYEQNLVWVAKDGTIQKEASVVLANTPDPLNESKVIPTLGLPVPIGWIYGLFMPYRQIGDFDDAYAEVIARRWNESWQTFVGVLLIGAALAAWTYYFQQKYRRPMTIAWCAFVFLVGWPGFLAYLFEHRRPKLEACTECRQVVPRNRDACAVCSTPFPAPAALGTEIFA